MNDILRVFEKNSKRIINDYTINSQRIVDQGINIITQCYESLGDRRASDVLSLQFDKLVDKDSFSKTNIFVKKTMTD